MRYWTVERVLTAITAWERQHGAPPTSTEWRTATPRTPAAQTVHELFGSWNMAIACAGFRPRRTGPRKLIGQDAA